MWNGCIITQEMVIKMVLTSGCLFLHEYQDTVSKDTKIMWL